MPVKNIKAFLLWTLLVPVILIAAAVIYYQFDESLRPEAAAVLSYTPEPVAVEQNGYYSLIGMFGPAGVDPGKKGLEIVTQAKQRHAEKNMIPITDVSEVRDAMVITPQFGSLKVCEDKPGAACLAEVRNNKAAYQSLIENNQLLLKRYRAIHQYPKMQETSYIFGFSNTAKMNRLAQVEIALKWDAKDYKQALMLLNDENTFWRRSLSSDTSLVSRIIALAVLQRNLRLTAELIADCSRCISDVVMLGIHNPITATEQSMHKVLSYEYKFSYSMLNVGVAEAKKESTKANLLYSLAFKKNATANKFYNTHYRTVQLSECPMDHYVTCFQDYKKFINRKVDYLSLEFLDDPVGITMMDIATPSYDSYVFAAIKYEAMRRLVLAKYNIEKGAIKMNTIDTYLQSPSNEYANPVTGNIIEWDAKQRKLRMSFPVEIEQQAVEVAL